MLQILKRESSNSQRHSTRGVALRGIKQVAQSDLTGRSAVPACIHVSESDPVGSRGSTRNVETSGPHGGLTRVVLASLMKTNPKMERVKCKSL